MFKDTKSHGLVSVQFLSALNLFFGGDIQLSKDAITELYKNLFLETLRGERQAEFHKMSELIAQINFKMKYSILTNIDDQDKAVKRNNENITDTYIFFKKLSDEDGFEHEIAEDILKDEPYEHKKVETPYSEPTVQDVATIDDQIKKEIVDFLQLAS